MRFMEKDDEIINMEGVIAHCYKCKSRVEFSANTATKYWLCPHCKQMNKCENLIKQILKDTIFDVKISEKDVKE